MPFPDYTPTVPEFIRAGERFAGSLLIVLEGRRLHYGEAAERSARLARGLLASGVGKGTRVGILGPNGPEWLLGFLAATRLGAVAVPINTFFQARELGWILRHADVHTLLSASRLLGHDYLERLEGVAPGLAGQRPGELAVPELPHLRQVFAWGGCDRAWAQPLEGLEGLAAARPALDAAFLGRVEACVAPADPLVVIYTSGSTAEPKGAIHSHGALIRHSFHLNSFRDLRPDDRVFSPMPFFWTGGLVYSLFACMHAGASVLCEEAFEPGRTLELLERERATVVAGWPHYGKAMIDHPSFGRRDLSAIRSGNLYEILAPEARPADPELRSNSLGMTETCGPHTIDRMDVDLPEVLRGSFGRPVPGLEHRIVDPESGRALGPGETGEICVRGYSLMQGLQKLEREQVFDADGFYHTGDVGRFDAEGHLFFQGRLGDLIKTAGANVTPREVEVAMESLPGVRSAFVVGVPHPTRGQEVVAAVVAKGGAAPDEGELRERLRSELAAYKVPRRVFFYAADELPFTESGKIDKRRLALLLGERLER